MRKLLIAQMLIALLGCGMETKGIESELPGSGKDDSFRRPTEHGTLDLNSTEDFRIQEGKRFHAWDFELTPELDIDVELGFSLWPVVAIADFDGNVREGSTTPNNMDTVMYLYRHNGEGWGRYIERNDDDSDERDTFLSAIRGEFPPGRYRILVKGYSEDHNGPVTLVSHCSGTSGNGDRPCVNGEGIARVRVPLVGEESGEFLADEYNEQLIAGGFGSMPRFAIEGSTQERTFGDWMNFLEDAFAELDIHDLPLTGTGPDDFMRDDAEICYEGDPSRAVDIVSSLADSAFSDQFILWAWRTPTDSGSTYEEWEGIPDALFDDYAEEWDDYTSDDGSLLLIWGVSDSGDDRYATTIPHC